MSERNHIIVTTKCDIWLRDDMTSYPSTDLQDEPCSSLVVNLNGEVTGSEIWFCGRSSMDLTQFDPASLAKFPEGRTDLAEQTKSSESLASALREQLSSRICHETFKDSIRASETLNKTVVNSVADFIKENYPPQTDEDARIAITNCKMVMESGYHLPTKEVSVEI